MATDTDIRREQVRSLLERAELELRESIARVDQMGEYELAEFRGSAASLVAIFDKNGTCATSALGRFDTLAFFDKNGTCASPELRSFDSTAFFDKNGTCAAPGERLAERLSTTISKTRERG